MLSLSSVFRPALAPVPLARAVLFASAAALLLCGVAPSEQTPQPAPLLSGPPSLSAPRTLATPGPRSRRKTSTAVRIGGQFDVGVPDGLMLGLVVALPGSTRVHLAAGYNTISPGLRLGVDWLPLKNLWVLSAQAGHYFEGNASYLAGDSNGADNVLLERVAYDFASLRTGIELPLGPVEFLATAGLGYVRAPIRQVEQLLNPSATGNGNTTILVPETPTLSLWLPSVQFGLRLTL